VNFIALLSTIATLLAGHPAHVTCGGIDPGRTWADNDGWAYVGGDESGLSSATCRGLRNVQRHHLRTETEIGVAAGAIWTLAHETGHLHGISNEQTANCWGLRWFKRVAADLGATTSERSRLWSALGGDLLVRQYCR